jgi:hypothetical protein
MIISLFVPFDRAIHFHNVAIVCDTVHIVDSNVDIVYAWKYYVDVFDDS